jgi:hypothetical protein
MAHGKWTANGTILTKELSEKINSYKKSDGRWNSPAFLMAVCQNGGWPERDKLPTKDPIGDVDDPVDEWVEGYKRWQADQKAYELAMRPHLKVSEGKKFDLGFEFVPKTEPKCTCGVHAVHGKVPAHAHASYCDLKKSI